MPLKPASKKAGMAESETTRADRYQVQNRESSEERENQSKLTGEWIVFAKHQGRNYYVTLATHTTGDQHTFDEIKSMAHAEFPFLA